MEKMHTSFELSNPPIPEENMINLAEEVLGAIPDWYWKNKKVIEKNRADLNEWTRKTNATIKEMLDRLDCTLQ